MSGPRSRAVAWVATGVLGGAIVTGAVVSQLTAATAASPSPAPGQTQPYGYGPGGGMGPGAGMPMGGLRGMRDMPGMRGLGRVAHGELRVQTKTGTFETVVVQNGKVTAVDTTAKTIDVKSADGFTATYRVDSNTRIRKDGAAAKLADIKVGDTVHLGAVKASDGTLTARVIRDGVRPGPGMHRGWGKDDAPAPNGTATPSTST